MKIVYRWRYDAAYYRIVIDRYYRQLPFVLHLPTQFALLWLLLGVVGWSLLDIPLTGFLLWAIPMGVIGVPALVFLTKKAIFLKYRARASFGSEACYSLTETGGQIQQQSGANDFPWSCFRGRNSET